jgi:hypothetical protein
MTIAKIIGAFIVLFWLAFWGGIIYAVIHFVAKFW